MIEELYQLKELIAAIGVSAVFGASAAYALFRFFGKNWLEAKFKKQLSRFNHEQNKEIARLKVEVDSMLNAKITLQQKSFEGLSEIWNVISTFDSVVSEIIANNTVFSNLETLDDENLQKFFEDGLKLPITQFESLRVSADKNKTAVYLAEHNKITKAMKLQKEVSRIIQKYSIFVSPDITTSSRNILINISGSLSKYMNSYTTKNRETVKAELQGKLPQTALQMQLLAVNIQEKINS